MERHQPRSVSSRLKRAALFVAIVWALAGTFVVFDVLSMTATDAMLAHPGAVGDLALPPEIQQSTSCVVKPGESASQAARVPTQELRESAWLLGVYHGSDTQSGTPIGASSDAQSVSEVQRLAERLAVPRPGRFSAREFANAHSEFVAFVEADESGTAHRLAVAYSPEACQIYKLGAYWGYTMWIRVAVPGRPSAMAIPIHHYARQVGVPAPLTNQLITPASTGATPAERAAEAIALTEAVGKHLTATP
jgi:hypothetical protein